MHASAVRNFQHTTRTISNRQTTIDVVQAELVAFVELLWRARESDVYHVHVTVLCVGSMQFVAHRLQTCT